MKEKQKAKINLLHETNSKILETCLHTWNFLMIQECIIIPCPVKWQAGYSGFTTASCSSFLSVLPCKTLRWEGFQSLGKGRRKASPEKFHPQFSHSLPAQASASAIFHDTSTWIFPRADVRAFSWRKSCIYWAGKEGGLPQQPFSMWPLCSSAAQASTLQELRVPAETLQREGTGTFPAARAVLLL